jgi:hypothetical protein
MTGFYPMLAVGRIKEMFSKAALRGVSFDAQASLDESND